MICMFIDGDEALRTDLVMFVMCAVPGQWDRCEEIKDMDINSKTFLED